MPTRTFEPAISAQPPQVIDAINTIQAHLDKEAMGRSQTALAPKELCVLQKVELVEDLLALLT